MAQIATSPAKLATSQRTHAREPDVLRSATSRAELTWSLMRLGVVEVAQLTNSAVQFTPCSCAVRALGAIHS